MSVRLQNFGPHQSYTIATNTASSVNQTFTNYTPPTGNSLTAIRIANAASGVAFARWGKGTQTATTTDTADTPILSGEDVVFDMSAGMTDVAAILLSGTGNVYVTVGDGS